MEILKEESMSGKDIDIGEFIEVFIGLEEMLRNIYYDYGGTKERVSAGQIIEYLSNTGALEDIDTGMLREITRYRNLVVHGEVESVDQEAMNELQNMTDRVEMLHEEVGPQAEPE
ncbi:hypothetical protein D3261_13000 [Halococcus sp. IIIV-5B]|nr:hypothetical protein D3261_13000 [Halococcus sp. IIIV-5B]